MNRLLSYLCLFIFFVPAIVFGQAINIQQTLTPAELVQQVLVGEGVQVFNIKYNGSAANANLQRNNVSYFDNNGITAFPIAEGLLLSTGNGTVAKGPNNSGSKSAIYTAGGVPSDPDLTSIATGGVNYGVVLEFDFIPSGDTISFQYFFASEEYPEFSPSSFNDAFGFFLSGPGINGTYQFNGVNIATIPGTNLPVTINNITPSSPYYNANNTAPLNQAMQFDGYIDNFIAGAHVQCGQTYHIKLCIANISDNAYDSGVFIQANSFSSDAVQVSVATVTGDNTIIEGCTQADIIFTRPENQTDTAMTVNYTLGGNAVSGVNYEPLPNPIQFQPGEDSLVVSLIPIQDGVNTGTDSVVITVSIINQCGDTIISQGVIYIQDSPTLSMTVNNPTIYCANDSVGVNAQASGAGKEPFTYLWSTGATDSATVVATSINGPFEYYITATDACGFSITDTVHINLEQTLMIDTLIATKSQACKPTGNLVAQVHGVTGTPIYSWKDTLTNEISTTMTATNVGGGWYYFTVKDNLCEMTDSVFVETINAPIAVIVPDTTVGCNPTTFKLTNGSQNANNYVWTINGTNQTVSTNATQSVTMANDAAPTQTIRLIASNGTCSDTTTVNLSIIHCGCMDPLSINYDALAVQDDGSCVYHAPVVVLPNAFTPDGDGVNETYQFVDFDYVDKIEYWILNRWGNKMYSFKLEKPGETIDATDMKWWDGKTDGGQFAADGIYFAKYIAHGINGETVEGQSFLHLIRKK